MTALRSRPWFRRFWSVAGAVSVRTKILGMVLGLVLLLGLGITLQVRATLSRSLQDELQEQAVSVGRDLAARSADLILIKDLYGLHQLLEETRVNNPNVRYAFVLDDQRRVLAHTFGEGFPRDLVAANSVQPTEHHRIHSLFTEEGQVWDAAVPILFGRAGTARVGLHEAGVRGAVAAVTTQMLLATAAVSAIGIAAAVLLTWILTRPLLNLTQAAQAVGRGDLTQRVPRWADDELGDLAESFNRMTDALARAEVERLERESMRDHYVNQVIAAQEEERKRIARELHDSTSQSLTSLLVGLRRLSDAVPPSDVQQLANDLRSVASQALDEVHTLALQLRPSVLDDLGLAAAMERFVGETRARYGLSIDLAIHGIEEDRLAPAVETALYRIVQEALTNVARHASARTVSVLLERRPRSVLAIVEDDGAGFDVESIGQNGRLGLYGIRERAELLGGRMTLESTPSRGTGLYVEIPLPEEALPGG